MGAPPPPSPAQRVGQEIGDHPAFAAILILAFALLIGFLMHKLLSGTSSSSSTNTSDATGQQTLYVPTSNTFETINTTTNSNNTSTSTTTGGTSGGTSGGGPLPPTGPVQAIIRTKGGVPKWDNSHNGVPIRSAPNQNASVLGPWLAGWGGKVDLVSATPVNGWYTVDYYGHVGYLSTADVTSLSTSAGGLNPIDPLGAATSAGANPSGLY